MNISWNQILPVCISILIIIGVAILRAHSKTLAGIIVTMPLNIPIALWITYTAERGDAGEVLEFTEGLFVGLGATVLFTLTLWIAARAGLSLIPMLLASYGTWAVALVVQYVLRTYVL